MVWEPSQRGSALQPGVTPHSQWHSASLTVLSSLFWVLAAFPTVPLPSICWVPAVSKTDIGPAMSGGREWAAKQQTWSYHVGNDSCPKTRPVPRSWAGGSQEGHWEGLLGREQGGILGSGEGVSWCLVTGGFPFC